MLVWNSYIQTFCFWLCILAVLAVFIKCVICTQFIWFTCWKWTTDYLMFLPQMRWLFYILFSSSSIDVQPRLFSSINFIYFILKLNWIMLLKHKNITDGFGEFLCPAMNDNLSRYPMSPSFPQINNSLSYCWEVKRFGN